MKKNCSFYIIAFGLARSSTVFTLLWSSSSRFRYTHSHSHSPTSLSLCSPFPIPLLFPLFLTSSQSLSFISLSPCRTVPFVEPKFLLIGFVFGSHSSEMWIAFFPFLLLCVSLLFVLCEKERDREWESACVRVSECLRKNKRKCVRSVCECVCVLPKGVTLGRCPVIAHIPHTENSGPYQNFDTHFKPSHSRTCTRTLTRTRATHF